MISRARVVFSRLRALVTRSRRDREFEEELGEHLALLIEEEQARGASFSDARRLALVRLGQPATLADDNRDARSLPVLQNLSRDLQYGLRTLRKSPGFTAVAVISLGLGVGANTALFSLMDALLLRPLPVAAPDRLVYIQRTAQTSNKRLGLDRTALDGVRELHATFAGVAASLPMVQPGLTIDGAPEPDRLVMQATDNFFSVLGVRPAAGRVEPPQTVNASEGTGGAVVISERFWSRRFGRRADVLGRALTVSDQAYPIIGVAESGFLGLSPDASVDVWLLSSSPRFLPPALIGRLQDRVAPEQGQDAVRAAFEALPAPPIDEPILTEVVAAAHGESGLRQEYRTALLALTALVALVLLVTCANLGTLLVVRNRARLHELAVRASLGAGRSRLAAQLFVESALIAAMGAAAAVLFARWGVAALLALLPLSEIPEQLTFHINVRVLAFLAVLSCLCAMLFGFLPAWRASRVDLTAALKSAVSPAGARGVRRLGSWMVGVQVALSVILVSGAGLFVQTLRNLAVANLGFDSRHLIQVELEGRASGIRPNQVPSLHEQLLERVSGVPGVSGVTMFGTPLFPRWATGPAPPPEYTAGIVAPGFFELMRIPLVRGRLFTAADATRTDGYSIVTESFARQMFPGGEEPIGKRAGFGNLEIIGIVRDARLNNVRWDVEPMVYRVGLRQDRLMSVLLVRSSIDPEPVMRSVREIVSTLNPRLLVSIREVDDVVGRSIARERIVALTSGFFGVLGLGLSGIGLFGVAAFTVIRRTSELGLRMALGATPWSVMRESLSETVRVVGWGVATGSLAALAIGRLAGSFISGLLFGLDATSWTNVTRAALLMVAIAASACVVPAIRAIRIDPLKAIRYE